MSNNDSNKSLNLNATEFVPKNLSSKNREDKPKRYNNRNKNNNNNNNNNNNRNNSGNNGHRYGGYNNKNKNNNNRRQNRNQYQQSSLNQSSTQSLEIDGPRNRRGEVELTNLINFTFPARQNNNHTVHYHRKKKVSYEPFNKQRFINSNYQFILKSDKNYEKHLQDPDAFIEWDNIQQVIIPTAEIPSCPICLNKPIVGKVTNCGHCFCYPCILHYLKVDSKEKYKSCPLCQDIITERSLKYVRFREVEKIKPDPNKRIEFKLMKRKMGTSLAIPKSTIINNILRMPRPNQTDLLPFAKLFYASSSYIKNEIILPAYHDLQEYLREVESEEKAARLSNIIIVSEIPYIQMAIKKVVEESKIYPDINIEEALKLLSQEEKKEIFKDTYASKIAGKSNESTAETTKSTNTARSKSETTENKKQTIKQWGKEMNLEEKKYQEKKLKEGGFEPAFSDDEENESDKITKEKSKNKKSNNGFDGEFILNNNNFYQSYSDESLNEIKEEEGKEGKINNKNDEKKRKRIYI